MVEIQALEISSLLWLRPRRNRSDDRRIPLDALLLLFLIMQNIVSFEKSVGQFLFFFVVVYDQQ